MKITERLKEKILEAGQNGFDTLVVTKGGNWNTPFIITIPFKDILKTETGKVLITPKLGIPVTKKNPIPETGILYHQLFKEFENDYDRELKEKRQALKERRKEKEEA